MRKLYLLFAAAALSCSALAAQAADLPTKAPTYAAPAPVDLFAGAFADFHVGGGWGKGELNINVKGIPDLKQDGFAGGVGFTQRWNVGNGLYVGWNTAVDWLGLKDTIHPGGVNVTTKQSWLGTTGLQLAYSPAPLPALLVYGGGGFAYGNVKTSVSVPGTSLSDSETAVGWYTQLGVQYSLASLAPNWYADVNWRHYDLGKVGMCGDIALGICAGTHEKVSGDIVQGGVVYRFATR